MYEILGLKHVFSTFQETVWSHLKGKKVHEDKNFGRQDVLQFFSEASKDYKYIKSPKAG